jgi:hypothetical protein
MNDSHITPAPPRRPTLALRKGAVARPRELFTIWCHGRRRPSRRHESEAAVQAELDRLTALPENAGLVFDVFRLTFVARRTGSVKP